jgi:hypothetical protein
MSLRNKMKTLLSQADRDAIDEHIQAIEDIIKGKLGSLNPDERVRYNRITQKNRLLVNKVYDFRKNQPNLSSPDIDWEEFESDYDARYFLESRAIFLSNIAHRFETTKIMHDSDNYEDALKDYAYSKYKNDNNEDGYSVKVDEIKQFFARTGIKNFKKKTEDNKTD